MTEEDSIVRVWEEEILLPAYPAMPADPNPMFLEKRVYQGSSGKVYPNPFTDRLSTEKSERTYRAIYLENEYVRLMILPEIGGRIHTGEDKTNGYDFFYRQNVIKPALVGLLGPWISGGVEFNWPQHHRPSTFMPVHTAIERAEDGSATVWLSEHDPMLRMKGMVGVCLHPKRSVVEAKVRLYNRTPFVQTFLWWANVAVRVHDQYQAFFPPDVAFVADHAKRAVSHFPIARNFYYGVDYTAGVDLRWYKNIPVPTSYMVTQSNYDFLGGYDQAREAGFVHVADRHIAPGKKLWTWGSGEFGQAWDRNLTDSDAPYVELMAGVYTDNQPDFSWLQPYETRSFSQFWYPIQKVGPVTCANVGAALSIQRNHESIRIGVCSSERFQCCSIQVRCGEQKIFAADVDIAPGKPWIGTFQDKRELEKLRFELRDGRGNLLLEYQPEAAHTSELPETATEPPPPGQIESADELYITGLHLEQYRHATRSPEPYWEEGLRRDAGDARMNNAMGLIALRRGEFARAENFFHAAVARLTRRNPNPRDGEPYYNLGLALAQQQRSDEAYAAFYKATWNGAWRSAAYYALAKIACTRGDFAEALRHLDESLKTDAENLKARDLKSAVLRRLGRKELASQLLDETLQRDPLDFLALVEKVFLQSPAAPGLDRDVLAKLDGDVQTALDIAYDYAAAGLLEEARGWLQLVAAGMNTHYPIIFYTLAWLVDRLGDDTTAEAYRERAASAPPLYCFPSRLEEMVVLEEALRRTPRDAKANYYLGNFYYDRRRFREGIACWRASVAADPSFAIPWRNLGIAEYNVQRDKEAALVAYAKAFEANPADARLLYEFDQLKKRMEFQPEERLAILERHGDLVEQRDDLSIERIALLNLTTQNERALGLLLGRRFNPWEGGEGLVSGQYVETHTALGRAAIEVGDFPRAARHFREARVYPENLGEGKHLLTLERQLDYWEGLALDRAGDGQRALKLYRTAAEPLMGYSVHSYYRALALRQLGRQEEAQSALRELYSYAVSHRHQEPVIDYFATSLPNFLLFEDDLKKRNTVDCLLLQAYAELGLGQTVRARKLFLEVATLEPSNANARQEITRLNRANTIREETRA
jgi:tetratricopeptide (TPR) repeat protein